MKPKCSRTRTAKLSKIIALSLKKWGKVIAGLAHRSLTWETLSGSAVAAQEINFIPLAKFCVFSKTGDPPSRDRVGGGVPPFFPIPTLCWASCATQGILGASDVPWSRHGRGYPSATLLPYVLKSVPGTALFLAQKWPLLLLIANWTAFCYQLVHLLPVGGGASAAACGGLSPRYLFKRYRVML